MKSVLFVCTGNICRSPMAMFVARDRAREAGFRNVEFHSGAVSAEEQGNPVYPPAVRVLAAHGHAHAPHAAHQVTAAEIRRADLVVAMTAAHRDALLRLAPDAASRIRLLTEFDPAADGDVVDPWYGDDDGYHATYASIDHAMPGLLAELRREP